MTVGRACEAIIRAASLTNPDRHALIATWRRAPHMIVQGCTLRPSEVLGERMGELPSCDGNIVLHYHVRTCAKIRLWR